MTAWPPGGTARRNLRSGLKRRKRSDQMRRFDALPPELRRWLHQAALPWSPDSALRLWRRALSECRGDVLAARARLDLAEARTLSRDAAMLWATGATVNHSASR